MPTSTDGRQCRPHPKVQCEIWRRIYSRKKHLIDEWTALDFEEFYCVDKCLLLSDPDKCRELKSEIKPVGSDVFMPACEWFGPESGELGGGSCAGNSQILREVIMASGEGINKPARFSYSVNVRDCDVICLKTGVGVLPDQCKKLRDCCIVGFNKEAENPFGVNFARCTFDNVILAEKYAPDLKPLAEHEMACRQYYRGDDCFAVDSDDIRYPPF